MAGRGPHDSRKHLTRIAALLGVTSATFRARRHPVDDGPGREERAEVALLFRRLTAPDQRAAVIALLRAMTRSA
ncbi:hypothetical protein [Methylobacterium sp. J-076]|uniref:hypothetical protein n=1 Tax=Methylobacterium sp. J-076 TaxID=2836655 RepID=UPI001FB8A2E0|nr:hypothetical protein [Methylobacterium sp. J-076]MCJ2015407.1 hypothetical protein [Methylobacterium sp. J-076]